MTNTLRVAFSRSCQTKRQRYSSAFLSMNPYAWEIIGGEDANKRNVFIQHWLFCNCSCFGFLMTILWISIRPTLFHLERAIPKQLSKIKMSLFTGEEKGGKKCNRGDLWLVISFHATFPVITILRKEDLFSSSPFWNQYEKTYVLLKDLSASPWAIWIKREDQSMAPSISDVVADG